MTARAINVGSVPFPLEDYAIVGNAVLGIRGAGKTYLAKSIAEQLLDFEVPIVVFDPIGQWHHLRRPRPGRGGRGFKVVVAGGREPDLPLTPDSAPELVRAAIRENIPLVIDLYDRKLSKSDWRKIVRSCFRTLLYENVGVRHVFLEETAEFAPQKVLDGETYAEVEKLVRMGGNASLGITLINQRAQEVNKAVLDLCENLVLMRQRGQRAIEQLTKWLEHLEPESAKAIGGGLAKMTTGDAWVFRGDGDRPVRTRAAALRSFHPDRRRPELLDAAGARTDTGDFVARMSGELERFVAQAEANDPAMLRKRIRDLERELEGRAPDPELARLQAENKDLCLHVKQLEKAIDSARGILGYQRLGAGNGTDPSPPAQFTGPYSEARALKDLQQFEVAETAAKSAIATMNAEPRGEKLRDLSKAQFRILRAFWWLQDENATPEKVSFYSGYSQSGHFGNELGKLRSAGLVDGWRITDAGRQIMAPAAEPKPTGMDLREWLRPKLGVAANRMLDALIAANGRRLSDDELAEQSGYRRSGHFGNELGRLRSLGAAEGYAKDGGTKAADVFYD